MKIFARRAFVLGLFALLLVLFAAPLLVFAQSYPTRRITLVVPYTPGSGFDIVARTVGQKISERWGQPVVIDNKPGASGSIGTESVAQAQPDGYTLLITGSPHTVFPSISKNLRFDPVASFTPLGIVGTGGLVLVVNPNVFPVRSLQEFIAQVKAKPRQLNYSSPGIGTLQHLGMELLKQQLGLEVQHVPYRGASIALTDLINGQVQFAYLPVHTALPHAQSGQLRMLAVASPRRSIHAPDVPSFGELGYPNVDFELWYGFFGPANLPRDVVQMWEKELAAIIELPDVKQKFQKQGLTPGFRNAQATGAHKQKEIARWRAVAERAGIRPE
jgi:tripartite-type tricarboxylate transporter receptor subunit TctC